MNKPLVDWTLAFLDLMDEWNATLPEPDRYAGTAMTTSPTPGSTDPLPAAQAYMFDGSADQLGGEAIVDVHFFASRYVDASRLSRSFEHHLMQYPHRVSSNGSSVLFDQVGTLSLPTEVEWVEDNSIRRFQATFSVSFRR